ncbi:hypothetical protein [Streptomyces echinatus]|uniref:hypothetical protein n=1 Tax=Streptomyces echinatus TaxID=67293 RepID=UPI003799576E
MKPVFVLLECPLPVRPPQRPGRRAAPVAGTPVVIWWSGQDPAAGLRAWAGLLFRSVLGFEVMAGELCLVVPGVRRSRWFVRRFLDRDFTDCLFSIRSRGRAGSNGSLVRVSCPG